MGNDVDKILQAVSIHNYIERFVPLKKRGTNFIGLCPFHSEKTPSFSVSPDKGIFKCFGCGMGGNVLTFAQEYHKVSFREALQILAEYSGIQLDDQPSAKKQPQQKKIKEQHYFILNWVKELYQKNLLPAYSYLQNRKVRDDSIQHFELGYAPAEFRFLESHIEKFFSEPEKIKKAYQTLLNLGLLVQNEDGSYYNRFRDRLIFPIRDIQNQVVGFGGRQLQKNEKSAKYLNSSESNFFLKKKILYHLAQAKESARQNRFIIVVEGYFDVLGLYQQGIENVVGTMGTAFTLEHARLLQRYCDYLILFFDNDSAGVEAAFKAFNVCKNVSLSARVITEHVGKTEKQDPFDISQSYDNLDLKMMLDNSKSELDFILWYFFDYKFNIHISDQKRFALQTFFDFLKTFENDWEKEEYLKKAAKVVNISEASLLKDFQKGKIGTVNNFSTKKKNIKQEKLPTLEKDFLAILLHYSDFWQQQNLLEQMRWQSQKLYLLYSFFRDRAFSGNFLAKDSSHIIQEMPTELATIFSEIIMNENNLFKEKDETEKDKEENQKKYQKILRSIIWRSAINYYAQKHEELIKKLEIEQNSISNNADSQKLQESLAQEIQKIIDKQQTYKELLQKERN